MRVVLNPVLIRGFFFFLKKRSCRLATSVFSPRLSSRSTLTHSLWLQVKQRVSFEDQRDTYMYRFFFKLSYQRRLSGHILSSYLEVVGLVVVHVERPEELGLAAHRQLLHAGHALVDGLPGELLHLDVVELPEVAEPLDQLRGDAAVELQENQTTTHHQMSELLLAC